MGAQNGTQEFDWLSWLVRPQVHNTTGNFKHTG
jgi:hypothetical protein